MLPSPHHNNIAVDNSNKQQWSYPKILILSIQFFLNKDWVPAIFLRMKTKCFGHKFPILNDEKAMW